MRINGNDYNFGRVVYLTLGKVNGMKDVYKYQGTFGNLSDKVTIAFDPKTNAQLTTRIDFLVRHQYGAVSSVTKSACSIASIDIYNIGPALEQFMNAYNVSLMSGTQKADSITKYVCCLQVGYYGGEITTIFAGVVNSYNVERIQSEKQVDTVWHLYAAGTGGAGQVNVTPLTDVELAEIGKNYSEEAMKEDQLLQSFVSGEEFIKAAVMKYPREVFETEPASNVVSSESFSLDSLVSTKQPMASMMVTKEITNENFNKYFKILYKPYGNGPEDYETRMLWTRNSAIPAGNFDYSNLQGALSDIARIKNCGAYLDSDYNTGLQTIYIWRDSIEGKEKYTGTPHIIKNFEHLLKPPSVSGRLIQFTLILEPSMRARDTIEMRIDGKFGLTHKNFSFDVDYGGQLGNWSSAFAGSSFIGITQIQQETNKVETIKTKGNIFNKKYQVLFVVHRGSTHTSEWSTQADCSVTVD